MKKQDFQEFFKCLIEALQNIESHYFQLRFAGNDELKYRERVYCYELYHQLRLLLGVDFSYKLDGELDKAGHVIIKGRKKPDFVVHIPGQMEKNLVVMEVKSLLAIQRDIEELIEDIEKLERFIASPVNYYRAIMLIYGSINGDLPHYIKNVIESIQNKKIITLWHDTPNDQPKIIGGERYID